MLINGTLWVQIFNFLLFYFIFKKIFLKPAVSIIKSEIDYKSLIENKINIATEDVRSQKDLQKEIWENCRLNAEVNKPNIFEPVISIFKPEIKFEDNSYYNLEKNKTIDKVINKAVVEDIKKLVLEKAHEF